MKVAVGSKLQKGPWGGGNQAIQAIKEYLLKSGIEVTHNLNSSDIDIILLTDPRAASLSAAFSLQEIIKYRRRHPNVLLVHRVNECDERKGTDTVNRELRKANLHADATIFVSDWLKGLHIEQGMQARRSSVIHNGSDPRIFNALDQIPWNGEEPLRIVTHHWGTHPNKGFDVYESLDRACGESEWRAKIQFTYIGRKPDTLEFKNTQYAPALSGHELVKELSRNHVYITASRFEPGSNHQNEGALCGLPIIYGKDLSMGEYCKGYGVEFDGLLWEQALRQMMQSYNEFREAVKNYPFTSELMSRKYELLFEELIKERGEIIKARGKKSLWKRILNQG